MYITFISNGRWIKDGTTSVSSAATKVYETHKTYKKAFYLIMFLIYCESINALVIFLDLSLHKTMKATLWSKQNYIYTPDNQKQQLICSI